MLWSSAALTGLFVWVIFAAYVYLTRPGREAILLAIISSSLFAPVVAQRITGLPPVTKVTVTCFVLLVFTLIRFPTAMLSFRFKWYDLPIIAWCIVPYCTAISNNLGETDGYYNVLSQILVWLVPYVIGRKFFSTEDGIQRILRGIYFGAIAYIPFCLYEIRFSPQLHAMFFGYGQHDFGQTLRFGGYRPMVFMVHGLWVGMWMTAASFCGLSLRAAGLVKSKGLFSNRCLGGMLIVMVMVKSSFAIGLLPLGVLVFVGCRKYKSVIPILIILAIPPAYIFARMTGIWGGGEAVSLSASVVDGDRAQSIEYRQMNEELIFEHVKQRPIFGWGGFGRSNTVIDQRGNERRIVFDQLWSVALAFYGFFGMVSCVLSLIIIPGILGIRGVRACNGMGKNSSPFLPATILIVLYGLNNVLNSMNDPIFTTLLGALCGITPKLSESTEPKIELSLVSASNAASAAPSSP